MNNETVMAISDFPVAIANTSWCTLPNEFPAICPNFKAVAVVTSLVLITHKSKECHVNRSHAKLESFEVKAEVLAKTIKYLCKEMSTGKHENQMEESILNREIRLHLHKLKNIILAKFYVNTSTYYITIS